MCNRPVLHASVIVIARRSRVVILNQAVVRVTFANAGVFERASARSPPPRGNECILFHYFPTCPSADQRLGFHPHFRRRFRVDLLEG